MGAEQPRDVDDTVTEVVSRVPTFLRGCGGELVARALFLLLGGGISLGMGLLIRYMGLPLTLASLFVLLVVLLEFWPREPYPPRSPHRWLYYVPVAGLGVSILYTIHLWIQDSADVGWWIFIAIGMFVLVVLASKIDRWLRRDSS
jgi:tellurite resistance protein TehA-like permease